MMILPEDAAGTAEHKGKTYYFCSAGYVAKFKGDPEKYLAPALTEATVKDATRKGVADAEYICPMDPEVHQRGAGACPKYGMADVVKAHQQAGEIAAMAGDGGNDAPALAQANVGIAIGTGTDVAMEAGGITLLTGDLRGMLSARHLSQSTMSNIRQSHFLASTLFRSSRTHFVCGAQSSDRERLNHIPVAQSVAVNTFDFHRSRHESTS